MLGPMSAGSHVRRTWHHARLASWLLVALLVLPALARALTVDFVSRGMTECAPRIRACYERGLASRPELGGRLEVRFVIGPDGVVSGAHVHRSTLESPSVEACIVEEISRQRFDTRGSQAAITVTYPLLFSP